MKKKYSLTNETKNLLGTILYQIKAKHDFGDVKKGELGGFIEKEENLSHEGNAMVYGNASVSENAMVYGNASVSAKAHYTKGLFIGGDNSEKITRLTSDETGNKYWKAQYVLGDYEITPISHELMSGKELEVNIDGKVYQAVIK